MGRAKRVSKTTATSGLAIEYVRSRRVLRLLGHFRGEELAPLEIPVDQLCEELGVEPHDLGSPETYLLFAGIHGRAAGGLRDLIRTFATEEEGRRAFTALRVQHPATGGWAELAAVDGFGRVRQVCWFGMEADGTDASSRSGRDAEVLAMTTRRGALRRLIAVVGDRPSGEVSSF